MKDLGYQRTPTEAKIRVTMPDGSMYDVPAQLVADSRDEHYKDEQEDTVGFIRAGSLDNYELLDWAVGNMNWDEVDMCAVKVVEPVPTPDFQEGWVNGEKAIVGKI